MKKQLDGKTIVPDGIYTVQENGSICNGSFCLTVEVEGERPEARSTITITDGKIADYTLVISGETILKEQLCTANTIKPIALVWDGIADVDLELAYLNQEVGLLASESGKFTKGVSYTCNLGDSDDSKGLTFYVLDADASEEGNVRLIAGFNLGGTVAWASDGNNYKDNPEEQAVTAKAELIARTTGWNKLNQSQIKMPTKEQIEGSYSVEMPTWLYVNTNGYNGPKGYWTSSPYDDNSSSAWRVYCKGSMGIGRVIVDYSYGVRPVIIINKNQLK